VAPALGLQIAKHLTLRPLSALDRAMSELAKPASPRGIAIAGAALLAVSAVALWDGAAREASAITPKAAVAAVAARHLQGPVFNDYAFGGYLVFAGIEPFIDGRYFYGDAFIKRCVDATLLLSGRAASATCGVRDRLDPAHPAESGGGAARSFAGLAAVLHRRHCCRACP